MGNRILVADDSATFRTIIAATLKQSGQTVTLAEDGRDALNSLNGAAFDLFIVDINMPRLDGVQFITEMRKIPRFQKVPVIVLAAQDEADEHDALRSVESLYCIEKGFEPASFVEEVVSIAERSAQN